MALLMSNGSVSVIRDGVAVAGLQGVRAMIDHFREERMRDTPVGGAMIYTVLVDFGLDIRNDDAVTIDTWNGRSFGRTYLVYDAANGGGLGLQVTILHLGDLRVGGR